MKCILRSGKHTRFEDGLAVRYQPGDVFEATEAELKMFGDRLEPIVEPATIDSDKNSGEIRAEMPAATFTESPTVVEEPLELALIAEIGAEIAKALETAGITTLADLARVASGPELAAIAGIGKARATKIRKALMAAEEQPETFAEIKTQEGELFIVDETNADAVHSTDLDEAAAAQGPELES